MPFGGGYGVGASDSQSSLSSCGDLDSSELDAPAGAAMMLQAEARTTAAVTNECIANVVACQIAVGGDRLL